MFSGPVHDRVNFDFVAANLAGDVGKIGRGRDDFQICMRE